MQPAFLYPHAGKATDDGKPSPSHVCHMQSVPRVPMGVIQIETRRFHEIVVRFLMITEFRCHDTENAMGKRRIMSGDFFIVIIGMFHRFHILFIFHQKMGENRVRLLANLVAI